MDIIYKCIIVHCTFNQYSYTETTSATVSNVAIVMPCAHLNFEKFKLKTLRCRIDKKGAGGNDSTITEFAHLH